MLIKNQVFPPSEKADSETNESESFLPELLSETKKTNKIRILDNIPSAISNIGKFLKHFLTYFIKVEYLM